MEVDGASEFARDRNRLCIEDPFDTSYNVARTVTADGKLYYYTLKLTNPFYNFKIGLYTIRGEFMRASRMLQTVGKSEVLPSHVLVELCDERDEALVPAPYTGNRTPRPILSTTLQPTLGPTLHPPPLQPTIPHIAPNQAHSYSPTQSQSTIVPSRKQSDQVSSPPLHSIHPRGRLSSHAHALSLALNAAQHERLRNSHEEHIMYQHPQSHTKPLGSAFWEAENLVSDESMRDPTTTIPRRASSGANVGPAWLSRLHERKYAPRHHLKAAIPNVSGPYADSSSMESASAAIWPPVPIPAPLRHSPRLANAALHSRATSSAAAAAAAATTASSVNASPSQLLQKQMQNSIARDDLKIRVPTFVTNGAGQQIRITPSTLTQPSESGTPTNSPPLSTTSTLSAPVGSSHPHTYSQGPSREPQGLGLGFPTGSGPQRNFMFGETVFAPESLMTSALTLADVRVPPPKMSARRWLRSQRQQQHQSYETNDNQRDRHHSDNESVSHERRVLTRSRSVPSTPHQVRTPRISSREFEKSVNGGRTYSRIIPNATLPFINGVKENEDTPPFKPNLNVNLDEGFPALSSRSNTFRNSSSLSNLYSASLQASQRKQQSVQQHNEDKGKKRRSASVGSSDGKKEQQKNSNSNNKNNKKSKEKQHQRRHSSQSK